jgi:hypothetical protein
MAFKMKGHTLPGPFQKKTGPIGGWALGYLAKKAKDYLSKEKEEESKPKYPDKEMQAKSVYPPGHPFYGGEKKRKNK